MNHNRTCFLSISPSPTASKKSTSSYLDYDYLILIAYLGVYFIETDVGFTCLYTEEGIMYISSES